MALYFNGTEISQSSDVYFNGTSLTEVYFNGTLVWSKGTAGCVTCDYATAFGDTQYVIKNADGDWTFTTPPGIDLVKVCAVGGGGSGGSQLAYHDDNDYAGGGGAGKYFNKVFLMDPSETVPIIIGKGGQSYYSDVGERDGYAGESTKFGTSEAAGGLKGVACESCTPDFPGNGETLTFPCGDGTHVNGNKFQDPGGSAGYGGEASPFGDGGNAAHGGGSSSGPGGIGAGSGAYYDNTDDGGTTAAGGNGRVEICWGNVQQQVFDSSSTFTVPSGVYQVHVCMTGAGGGGAGSSSSQNGGGNCGQLINQLIDVTPGDSITVTVGTGGTGGTNGNGSNGGNSVFGSVTASGGEGGKSNSTTYNGNGNLKTSCGGQNRDGYKSSGTNYGGISNGFGAGGNGSDGNSGGWGSYGAGGGASSQTGGNGGNGRVIVRWIP